MYRISFVVTQVAQSLESFNFFKDQPRLLLTLRPDCVGEYDPNFLLRRDEFLTVLVPDNEENRNAMGKRLSVDFSFIEQINPKAA